MNACTFVYKRFGTMRALLVLFLVGCAAAVSLHEALDRAADEIVADFVAGMQEAPRLRDYVDVEDVQEADETDDNIKTELGKQLRDSLNKLLERIKDAVDQGKTVKQDVIDKLKEVRQKLKELKVDLGTKAKDLLEKIKNKAKDFFDKFLDKLTKSKRALNEIDEALAEFDLREFLRELKKHILSKVDAEVIKEKLIKVLGQGSELLKHFLKTLSEKGKDKVLEIIDRLLEEDDDDTREARSVNEALQKVKDYFKKLDIELKENYAKFGEWVERTIKSGLEKAKGKIANIKAIAKELVEKARNVSKEVAVEAIEFLRPYKDDLGTIWDDVKESVKEILRRKD